MRAHARRRSKTFIRVARTRARDILRQTSHTLTPHSLALAMFATTTRRVSKYCLSSSSSCLSFTALRGTIAQGDGTHASGWSEALATPSSTASRVTSTNGANVSYGRDRNTSSSPYARTWRSFAASASSKEEDRRAVSNRGGFAASEDPAPEASNTWVENVLPSSMVPYAKLIRLDRPIGTALLAWPCFWSIALAAPVGALPDVGLLATFGVGSLLLRGAGCTVNDLWDRDIDSKVARTRNRPIASGAISVPKAVAFLGAQLGLGLIVLLQLNDYSKILGASSLALVGAYPAMKRITNWPQAFLGLTFNWGALLGWAAVHGSCDWGAVLPLYASGVAWTLVYDTIYAHQDKSDDVKVGVKSTALHFGDDTKKYLSAFAVAGTSALCASGAYVGLDWPFYAGVATAASHLVWQISTVDLNDRDDCAAKFKSNSTYGALVFASIIAGKTLSLGSL